MLSSFLRREMQNVLDELQQDTENELEKVSLERLADLNPDLLSNIKQTAQDNLQNLSGFNNVNNNDNNDHSTLRSSLLSFLSETRSHAILQHAKAWDELDWNIKEQTHDAVAKLQHRFRDDASSNHRYTQSEAIAMTQYLAAASATSTLLTTAMERIQNQADQKDKKQRMSFPGANNRAFGKARSAFGVDRTQFTNKGIKEKNETVIGFLYEVGLPFLSSADGRRFASQLELSNHLDALFKRNQLEKSVTRADERGWYVADFLWTGETREQEIRTDNHVLESSAAKVSVTSGSNFDESTMPADEARDRCVICGINFKMFFDNENGMYMYGNCREIEVINDDDVAINESDHMLVHLTCWRGLGAPEVLLSEQALQETMRL
jgi:pre-mRNA cleavage complex 2 protein Pcf11